MRVLGTTLMFTAALALYVFPLAYHFTSGGEWRRSEVGRALMAFMGTLALVMVLAVWARIFGPLPEFARVVVWGLISVVAWRQVWLLFAVRRRGLRQ